MKPQLQKVVLEAIKESRSRPLTKFEEVLAAVLMTAEACPTNGMARRGAVGIAALIDKALGDDDGN